MARKMWDKQPEAAVYRTVVVATYRADVPVTFDAEYVGSTAGRIFVSHYGPYSTAGAARTQLTRLRHKAMRTPAFRKGEADFRGWIEKSAIQWEVVEDPSFSD